jgi:hypothetical protein
MESPFDTMSAIPSVRPVMVFSRADSRFEHLPTSNLDNVAEVQQRSVIKRAEKKQRVGQAVESTESSQIDAGAGPRFVGL